MSRGRRSALLIGAVLASLGLATSVSAEHTRTTANISARVTHLRSTDYWTVEFSWSANCHGVPAGKAVYTGTIFMVDVETGERIYVQDVVDTSGRLSVSGKTTWAVSSRKRPWTLTPELTIGCHEEFPLDGGPRAIAEGAPVTIPSIFGGHGGGGGGGSGGGGGGGGPTDALGPRGCALAVLGTNRVDKLTGGGDGDVIVAFAAGDRLRGQGGHDCLVGGTGADQLEGEDGNDRLTGGKGRDLLIDKQGFNAFYGGSGGDVIVARNGVREPVRCGPGVDRAIVDRRDRTRSCEILSRGR